MTDDAEKIERSRRHAVRDAAIALLARDAAHDLKGVLNVIIMNLDLLSRFAQDPSSARLTVEQIERSASSAQRKLRQIERAIDVVLGARAGDPDFAEPFDLVALVESLLELAAGRAARQRVEVAFTAHGPVRITGNPFRLQSALLALVANALEAMPAGGRLEVGVSDAPAPTVRVSDTGEGVPPERQRAMWEPHVSTKPGASGLGLPVARAIVEAHGGALSYEDHPGGGSTFLVELPASR